MLHDLRSAWQPADIVQMVLCSLNLQHTTRKLGQWGVASNQAAKHDLLLARQPSALHGSAVCGWSAVPSDLV